MSQKVGNFQKSVNGRPAMARSVGTIWGVMHDVGEFTPEFLHQSIDDSMKLIQHMSGTIDDFRNFFRPNKEKMEFSVAELVEATVRLVGSAFDNSHIRIIVEKQDDIRVQGYPTEYAQVLLNVLMNAKDAFELRQTADPQVRIVVGRSGEKSRVSITDNAGGISEEVISKVFDPLFTTKQTHGTGIGLFMSKNIIEKSMNGSISVRNADKGAEFSIEVIVRVKPAELVYVVVPVSYDERLVV